MVVVLCKVGAEGKERRKGGKREKKKPAQKAEERHKSEERTTVRRRQRADPLHFLEARRFLAWKQRQYNLQRCCRL